ncbi:hypothetical protein MOA67_gp074 [Klebsiella phage KpLz-2_45]|uniref:hypothetical protein n=1 Tax=Klebsiella phage KpLz-2_45 TaxID=2698923 RepID=UPI001F13E365|nr:hypothetical protein MOA67_gp074 [Klebsiella phage KpLz-2_45]UKS71940.1 hypothetical protein KpLz245_0740 [Klebsiella phage KpLz-2_45]
MLIKFFGKVFATGVDKVTMENQKQFSGIGNGTALSNLAPENATYEESDPFVLWLNSLHPLTRAINWPSAGNDPFKEVGLRKLIMDFDTYAKQGWFSLCPVTNTCDLLGITRSLKGDLAYEKLRAIHCADFKIMDILVIRQIPKLCNDILDGVKHGNEFFRSFNN